VPTDERPATNSYEFLIEDGYILAFQEIRKRFKSEGEFVMQRPPRNLQDRDAIDESTDAYDSIDWMIKNVPNNNGRVGMLGVSYDGWLVTMALLDPHPALKGASEQPSPADVFLGDDFHHNGAFRLSFGFEYAALLETSKESNTNFAFDHADTYQSYLDLGVLSDANERYFHGKVPTWNDFVAHPNYDEFWQKQAFPRYVKGSEEVPNLNVAGWWDQDREIRSAAFELLGRGPVELWRMASRRRKTFRSIAIPASISATRLKLHGSPTGSTTRLPEFRRSYSLPNE
jgi:putative CocE/NonD family hydrolase